jgi:ORF6N domain
MRKLVTATVVVLLMFVASMSLAQPQQQQRRPNIVFILVDDLRWDELGVAGHPFLKTPHIRPSNYKLSTEPNTMRPQTSRKELITLSNTDLIHSDRIEKAIYFIRGEKVLLDRDLAFLYSVETKVLNRAVKRNLQRFPLDFMFQLTPEEAEILRCQIGTSSLRHGGRRYLPYVFTEQGVAMLSTVLDRNLGSRQMLCCIRWNDR